MKKYMIFLSAVITSFLSYQCESTSPEDIVKLANESRRRDSIENYPAKVREDSIRVSRRNDDIKEAEEYLSSFNMADHKGRDAAYYIQLCQDIKGYGKFGESLIRDLEVSNINKGKLITKKAKSILVSSMPTIRKQWANAIDKKLWENNIDVKCFGSGNKTLEFVGGIFASNANIKEFQNTLHEGLVKLGFKRTQYRWYDGDDEYTYYTIESDIDGTFN